MYTLIVCLYILTLNVTLIVCCTSWHLMYTRIVCLHLMYGLIVGCTSWHLKTVEHGVAPTLAISIAAVQFAVSI